MTAAPAISALHREADARTRTGDPFITRDVSMSTCGTPGRIPACLPVTDPATEDTNTRRERPQDAPSNRLILHAYAASDPTTAVCGAPIYIATGTEVTAATVERLECPVCRARERRRAVRSAA